MNGTPALRYEHTQRGAIVWMVPVIGGGVVALVMYRILSHGTSGPARLAMIATVMALLAVNAGVLVWVAISFSKLTVRVDDEAVEWWFGGGAFRRRVPLSAVASVESVRNEWWMGMGVRFIGKGWLYNVGGLDAVELRPVPGAKLPMDAKRFSMFRDASERARIGTDEPDQLRAAILAAQQRLR